MCNDLGGYNSFSGNVKEYVKNKLDTGNIMKPEYVDIVI